MRGTSVNNGTKAIVIPVALFFRNVSDMISICNGPGESPLVNPNNIPVIRKEISVLIYKIISINYLKFYVLHILDDTYMVRARKL